jgi:hypothetical protein
MSAGRGYNIREEGQQGRWAGSIDMHALSANVFAVAAKRINIHIKTGILGKNQSS